MQQYADILLLNYSTRLGRA